MKKMVKGSKNKYNYKLKDCEDLDELITKTEKAVDEAKKLLFL